MSFLRCSVANGLDPFVEIDPLDLVADVATIKDIGDVREWMNGKRSSNSRSPCSMRARTISKLKGFFSSIPSVLRTAMQTWPTRLMPFCDQGFVPFMKWLVAADKQGRRPFGIKHRGAIAVIACSAQYSGDPSGGTRRSN